MSIEIVVADVIAAVADVAAASADVVAAASADVVADSAIEVPKKNYVKYTHVFVPRVCFKRVLPFAIGLAKKHGGFAQNHYEDNEIVMCHRDLVVLNEMVEKVGELVREVELDCTRERKTVMDSRMQALRQEFHVVRRHIGGLDPGVVLACEIIPEGEIIIDSAFEFLAEKVSERFDVSTVEAMRMCKNCPISVNWDETSVTITAPKQILHELMAEVRSLITKVRRQHLLNSVHAE